MSDEGMSDEMLAVVRKDISSSGDFGEVAAHVAAALITRLAAAERERDALRDALQGMVRGCDYSHFSDAQLAAEAERYPSDWIDLITDARAALAATEEREAVARALCEARIRTVRRHDTKPEDLEAMLPASIDYSWRDFVAEADAALSALAPIRERERKAEHTLGYQLGVKHATDTAAAVVLAAEANERARIVAWLRAQAVKKAAARDHATDPDVRDHCDSSYLTYATSADAIEIGAGK